MLFDTAGCVCLIGLLGKGVEIICLEATREYTRHRIDLILHYTLQAVIILVLMLGYCRFSTVSLPY